MMSISPPGQRRRKARDLNPHGLAAARFSKPARQPVSGYPPYRVDPAGVEPAFADRLAPDRTAQLLDEPEAALAFDLRHTLLVQGSQGTALARLQPLDVGVNPAGASLIQ